MKFTFLAVSRNQFGYWGVSYDRGETRCFRQILDKEFHAIKGRKPIGQELLDTIATILGRKLTQN